MTLDTSSPAPLSRRGDVQRMHASSFQGGYMDSDDDYDPPKDFIDRDVIGPTTTSTGDPPRPACCSA